MIGTSGFVTALDRIKFIFGRGSVPDPAAWGAYSAPQPLAGLRGPTSKGKGEGKGKGRGKEEREEEGMGWDVPPPFRKFLDLPLFIIKIQN